MYSVIILKRKLRCCCVVVLCVCGGEGNVVLCVCVCVCVCVCQTYTNMLSFILIRLYDGAFWEIFRDDIFSILFLYLNINDEYL